MPRDDATVLDILEAARLIQEFVAGSDKPGSLPDAKTRSAGHRPPSTRRPPPRAG
jgi:hypothetical protein